MNNTYLAFDIVTNLMVVFVVILLLFRIRT